jgi:hypothetical protein
MPMKIGDCHTRARRDLSSEKVNIIKTSEPPSREHHHGRVARTGHRAPNKPGVATLRQYRDVVGGAGRNNCDGLLQIRGPRNG